MTEKVIDFHHRPLVRRFGCGGFVGFVGSSALHKLSGELWVKSVPVLDLLVAVMGWRGPTRSIPVRIVGVIIYEDDGNRR